MSDDALAALLQEFNQSVVFPYGVGYKRAAAWFRERGVVVLPPDHPLRTGEPSEAMKLAFIKAHVAAEGDWLPTEQWEAALDTGLRAALAVLREPLDKPTKGS